MVRLVAAEPGDDVDGYLVVEPPRPSSRTPALPGQISLGGDRRATVSGPRAQLPNTLTVARLVVIPIYAALILSSVNGHSWAAAILFAGAALTDQIDGFLARRWHVESRFGKIADPLADRLLIDIAVVLLWHAGQLPWAAFLIPARDVLLIALTPVALGRGYEFEVNFLGKLATWLLYASLAPRDGRPRTWPRWIFWTGFVARGDLARAVLPEGAEGDRRGAGNIEILKLRLTVCGPSAVISAQRTKGSRWKSSRNSAPLGRGAQAAEGRPRGAGARGQLSAPRPARQDRHPARRDRGAAPAHGGPRRSTSWTSTG